MVNPRETNTLELLGVNSPRVRGREGLDLELTPWLFVRGLEGRIRDFKWVCVGVRGGWRTAASILISLPELRAWKKSYSARTSHMHYSTHWNSRRLWTSSHGERISLRLRRYHVKLLMRLYHNVRVGPPRLFCKNCICCFPLHIVMKFYSLSRVVQSPAPS